MLSSDRIVAHLLLKRGVPESLQENFLHPDFLRDTHSPLRMKGMRQAVERLHLAIENNETVAVFGDYDADGVPATAVMVRGLEKLGVTPIAFIPTRAAGYGLNGSAVEKIRACGATLLITVDNGTTAQEEIAHLKQMGIDTIVCDHHQPQEEHIATDALAILNPKQKDCPYPWKELCGCAIGWKLLWALYEYRDVPTGSLKWELDLVALATVADMVPLMGENRILAWYGLEVMRKTRNSGLRALAEVAGVDVNTFSATDIGFRIAPRINAPSRMHAEEQGGENIPLKLLLTKDPLEANKLALYMQKKNVERQSLLEAHIQEAELQVGPLEDELCLILYGEQWSSGVIGLLAGRLMERYKRPVVALASEEGVIKGSVRSVDGIHAVNMIAAAESALSRYGGHAKAAGLSLRDPESLASFREQISAWMQNNGVTFETMALATQSQADIEIALCEVKLELIEALKVLEPFGTGFPAPVFQSCCFIENIRWVGAEQKHLSCCLVQGATKIKAIFFSCPSRDMQEGEEYNVQFTLGQEEWRGTTSVVCYIKQIMPV